MSKNALEIRLKAGEIVDGIEAEGRDMTVIEETTVNDMLAYAVALEATETRDAVKPVVRTALVDGPTEWRDQQTGRKVYALRAKHKLSDLPVETVAGLSERETHSLDFGRFLRGLVSGQWGGAELEQRALNAFNSVAGGVMVPTQLSRQFIDLVRARSVMISAGMQTMPMESDRMTVARLNSDPAISVKGENTEFTETDPTFDEIGFSAHTVGCLVKLSRELVDDAPNVEQILRDTITTAVAAEIDRLALNGSGSAEPNGLLNLNGVQTIGSVATLAYEDLLDAVEDLEQANHTPNAYILSPSNKRVLAGLLVNSEVNHYSTAPVDVSALSRFVTTKIADTTLVVGDFSRMLMGSRQAVQLEVTREGSGSFERHQLAIKATVRIDFNATHANAFNILTGIS